MLTPHEERAILENASDYKRNRIGYVDARGQRHL
jgi:hypothetical protein